MYLYSGTYIYESLEGRCTWCQMLSLIRGFVDLSSMYYTENEFDFFLYISLKVLQFNNVHLSNGYGNRIKYIK